LEYIDKTKKKQPEDFKRLEEMISVVRKDLTGLKNIITFKKKGKSNPNGLPYEKL
jgi:hypothetical protein